MYDLESRLRDEFDQPRPYAREAVADLVTSTRRIRRRRDTAKAAGAAGAVAAVVVAALALVPGRASVAPPKPAAPIIDANAMDRLQQNLTTHGRSLSAEFVDATHGFLMVLVCPKATAACLQRLVVTTDGGVTTAERTLPGDTSGALVAFDRDHLVVEQETATLRIPGASTATRWISADGGRSWTPVSTKAGAAVDTIPSGDVLLFLPALGGIDRPPVALGPDGVTHALRHVPSAALPVEPHSGGLSGGFVRDVGGVWFLRNEGGPADLVRSVDAGATWQPVSFASPAAGPISMTGGDGTAIYADVLEFAADGSLEHRVRVSRDRGATWSPIPMPALPTLSGPSSSGASAAEYVSMSAIGGQLLYSDGTGLYGSAGGPFTRIDDTTLLTYDAGVGVIGIRGTPDDPTVCYSTDGVDWTRLPL